MNFAFTEEQNDLRRTVRDFLDKFSPEAEVRRLMDTTAGYDPVAWRQLAGDVGIAGLAVPEEYGGAGCGFVELGIFLEESGRSLLCAPVMSTVVLATSTLLGLGDDEACRDYLPGIVAGTTVATVALTEPAGRWDAAGVTVTASRDAQGGGWQLDGTKSFVLDGQTASLLLVAARSDAGVSVFAVDAGAGPDADAGPGGGAGAGAGAGARGLQREPQATLDQTRKQATVRFSATPARLIGTEGAAWPTLARVLDLAAVAIAAEQVGGAAQVLDAAVAYAKTRVQFGRPIGSFQAVKHKLADMCVDVESARSAAYCGLWAADDANRSGTGALPEAASLAKACCGDAFVKAAAENVQVHGGIGVTWEHPAHLYLKRAHSSQSFFGHPTYHRQRLAQLVLADSPVDAPTTARQP